MKLKNFKTQHLTLHIKNSEISEYSGGVAHIGLSQICDLTNFKCCKFGSLRYRTKIL